MVAADQHARRAEAALQRVFRAERLAQPHHHGVVGETLDRPYIGAVAAHGEGQAGARRGAVEEDGAGAADALLTAEMGTGQALLLTKKVAEIRPRLDPPPAARPVAR